MYRISDLVGLLTFKKAYLTKIIIITILLSLVVAELRVVGLYHYGEQLPR